MDVPCTRRMLIYVTIVLQILVICSADPHESIESGTNRQSIGSTCTTPDQTGGRCVPLQNCTYAMSLPGSQLTAYARVASCHGSTSKSVIICCPNRINRTTATVTPVPDAWIFPSDDNFSDRKTDITSSLVSPTKTLTDFSRGSKGSQARKTSRTSSGLMECEAKVEKRIVGGEVTKLNEFPWMAILFYSRAGAKKLFPFCGGAVVTERYVLTAAHCLKNAQMTQRGIRLQKIRLGEYDLRNETDCITNEFGEETCANYQEFDYDRIISHKNYENANFKNRAYDIGLVRLSETIQFNDNIQPICVPSGPVNPSQEFYAIGWGATENSSYSDVRLAVKLSWFDLNGCNLTYATMNTYLNFGQFCVGGRAGQDTCLGDSGGPLVTPVRTGDEVDYWKLVGVTSFGHRNCGTQGWPGVYSNVWDYVSWIESNIGD